VAEPPHVLGSVLADNVDARGLWRPRPPPPPPSSSSRGTWRMDALPLISISQQHRAGTSGAASRGH